MKRTLHALALTLAAAKARMNIAVRISTMVGAGALSRKKLA